MKLTPKLLIIDDDPGIRTMLSYRLGIEGFVLEFCEDGKKAQERIQKGLDFDLVLLDVMLPEVKGDQLLAEIKIQYPELPVIMLTAFPSLKMGVEAIKKGAYDFITKPFDLEQLLTAIRNAVEHNALIKENRILRQALKKPAGFCDLIGQSPSMAKVKDNIRKAANSSATVLIQGPSGSGKEVAARLIHENSDRHANPFVAVNCGAIPENLIESELFGYEKGSFTGAEKQTKGKFESAQGGTLFLDEVGELPLQAQVKLLRVLQERELMRVGSTEKVKLNIRVIAATNRNLLEMTQAGHFREDLYYRLAIWLIELPNLNQRREDIPLLAQHFIKTFSELEGKPPVHLTPAAQLYLTQQAWPGNVRQLENFIYRNVVANEQKTELDALDLQEQDTSVPAALPAVSTFLPQAVIPLEELEKSAILNALAHYDGKATQAAEALGISRITLYRKLKSWGMTLDEVHAQVAT